MHYRNAYEALSLYYTILDPETIAAHHVGHHDIREQSIANNGNLGRGSDA